MNPIDGNVPEDAHPDIWKLVRYWQEIHPPDRLPGRKHFDPLDIPSLLPNIRLLDVVDGGPFHYRVRLIGTGHVKQLGYDPTGRWYETITNWFENSVVERDLAQVCRLCQPVYRKGLTIVPYETGTKVIERVHVPFASGGHDVDLIMSLTLFHPEQRIHHAPSLNTLLDAMESGVVVPLPEKKDDFEERQGALFDAASVEVPVFLERRPQAFFADPGR